MSALISQINRAKVGPGSLRIWWTGQEGFVIKSASLIIYIDPYLSTYAERVTKGRPYEHVRIKPAPMQPEDIDHADVVLCTHDHADHIDPESVPIIATASPRAQFVVPECALDTMLGLGVEKGRVCTMKGDDELQINDLSVHAIPAMHEDFDRHPEKGYPYLGYVISIDRINVFHAGDTIRYNGQAERLKQHRIDLAFLPINGRDEFRHGLDFAGNLDCEEAVRFARDISAGLTIPMHYDMFTINTADVNEFRRIADAHGLRYLVMDHAGSIRFPLEATHAARR
jgi:L-ascorbate metabolism protein UlaG (beta-lactamase superfamily)